MKNNPFENLKLGSFDFAEAVSRASVDGHEFVLDWQRAGEGYEFTNETGTWYLAVSKTADRIELKSKVRLYAPAEKLRFAVFAMPELDAGHLAISGQKMGGCKLFKAPVAEKQEFRSFYTCAVSRGSETMLILHPLHQNHYTTVCGTFEGETLKDFEIVSDMPHFGELETEFPVATLRIGDGMAVLREYGDSCAEVKQDFSAKPEYGWNSWDYYRWTVTEEEVLKNAEFIAKDKILSKHVKRIIVDDGWQYCYGEWEANHLFPSGMEKLAGELHKMNFVPGLWLAPTIVEPHCRIAQLDFDMLACSEGGQPCLCYSCMKRNGFVLDPTVEKSRVFIRDLFDRYVKRGYEYFKLDFLGSTLFAPRFADRSVPRGDIIRKVMDAVSEGVAGRAAVMGCNYPFATGNSYVFATRTGSDIHAEWEHIKTNTANTAFRFWMNKRLWINDPDFALCRGVDTSDYREILPPHMVFCAPESEFNPQYSQTFASATRSELEIWLSVVLMAAGAVNLSDDMTKLNESGLELARKVVSAKSGESGVPLDLFESALPEKWLQKLSHGGRALAVNWGESEKELDMTFAPMPGRVRDFWQGREISAPRRIILPPHSCKLFEW